MNMIQHLVKHAIHTPCAYTAAKGVTKHGDDAVAYRLSRPYKNYSHVVVTSERTLTGDRVLRRVALAIVGKGRFIPLLKVCSDGKPFTDAQMLKMLGYDAVGYKQ